MPKKSSFRHYSLNQAKRHQVETKNFLGVDYTTQKFLVANGRAIDLKNYVFKGTLVEKRHGYEQIFTIDDFDYIPASFSTPTQALVQEIHSNEHEKNINSIWAFEAEDGNVHIIAHIGNLLYEIKNINNTAISVTPILSSANATATVDNETHYLAYEFENYKSYAFVGGKKLWFLGGNKYMCLRFLSDNSYSFFAVEDSDRTPIPVTTISITYKNSIVNQRMSLDKVNLMTEWRVNKLVTGTTKNEDSKTQTTFYEYTLDAPLIYKDLKDMANVSVVIEERGKTE